MKTYVPKAAEIERRWHLVDADGKVLGRLAARIAVLLRGKHKPTFTPHADVGDFVVVVNAAGVRLTGRKLQQKKWVRHSGYPGGLKETSYEVLMQKHPERALVEAVRGMLPKTRQGRRLLKNLKVYRGPTHPHQAQQPAPMRV
ncbi:MAG: 50S ribosomal protein L13 [Armatimonadota bacterium]|nr:50S ribosomal protein L13 [Armatimonadota bacterium]MDR7518861.1 50S ribosomal protein L13 [Armatimonadota bacterium]MDR7549090.1 50S ribosomal protein L13 [Armatimonadota bacterium]